MSGVQTRLSASDLLAAKRLADWWYGTHCDQPNKRRGGLRSRRECLIAAVGEWAWHRLQPRQEWLSWEGFISKIVQTDRPDFRDVDGYGYEIKATDRYPAWLKVPREAIEAHPDWRFVTMYSTTDGQYELTDSWWSGEAYRSVGRLDSISHPERPPMWLIQDPDFARQQLCAGWWYGARR